VRISRNMTADFT